MELLGAETKSRKHMVTPQKQSPQPPSDDTATRDRLFLLDLSDDRIVSLNSDGSDRKVIVTGCRYPDGIAVDVAAGHVYWTNMGVPKSNDGSIERAGLDGRNRTTIVPEGETFTPKQIQLEKESGKLESLDVVVIWGVATWPATRVSA
jgi:hypothetical protein